MLSLYQGAPAPSNCSFFLLSPSLPHPNSLHCVFFISRFSAQRSPEEEPPTAQDGWWQKTLRTRLHASSQAHYLVAGSQGPGITAKGKSTFIKQQRLPQRSGELVLGPVGGEEAPGLSFPDETGCLSPARAPEHGRG